MTLTSNRTSQLEDGIFYPDSDGKPMADNTEQFRWIVTIEGGLEALFRARPDVFVAGDLLWYPVKGNNKLRMAPDALVVFGRPKGRRGSYKQWQEDNIAPQVVFEVLSPGNTRREMRQKLEFYQLYGVEEYYIYDPDEIRLEGYLRVDDKLEPVADMQGWSSPRLGIRFEITGDLTIYHPDGLPFTSFVETVEEARQAEEQARQAEEAARKALEQLEAERQRAERLAARLKELNISIDD